MIILNTYQLTKREAGILHLMCLGMGSKQTAASLFYSELTINTHRRKYSAQTGNKKSTGAGKFCKGKPVALRKKTDPIK